jgi:peptide/nickel transport system permease protein
MSEGRTYFQISPWIIFYPGIALAATVLAVNVMGDGLRDTLDPRIARKM